MYQKEAKQFSSSWGISLAESSFDILWHFETMVETMLVGIYKRIIIPSCLRCCGSTVNHTLSIIEGASGKKSPGISAPLANKLRPWAASEESLSRAAGVAPTAMWSPCCCVVRKAPRLTRFQEHDAFISIYTPSDKHGSSQKASVNGTKSSKGVLGASMLVCTRVGDFKTHMSCRLQCTLSEGP